VSFGDGGSGRDLPSRASTSDHALTFFISLLDTLSLIEACPRPQGADRPPIEVLVNRLNPVAHLRKCPNSGEIMLVLPKQGTDWRGSRCPAALGG
jgi:hypothetical protein